jgi:tetratricopeptide (TPR) repeat protein
VQESNLMDRWVAGVLLFAGVALCGLVLRWLRARRLRRMLPHQELPSDLRLLGEIQKYEQLTRDNPRDVEFHHIMAGLYREAEQWDKAIDAETQAIERHPKYAVAFWGRGKARMGKAAAGASSDPRQSDYCSSAVEDFTASIALFEMRGGLEMYLTVEQPSAEYIDCYRTRGVALAHLTKHAEGIADLSVALKLRNDDPKLLYERGYLQENAGLKKEAIPDYHRAGTIYADLHDTAAAQECIARLNRLGAKAQAEAVRLILAPKTPKSDLPK